MPIRQRPNTHVYLPFMRYRVRQVEVAQQPVRLVGRNPARVYIMFSRPTDSSETLLVAPDNLASDTGIVLPAGSNMEWWWERHGVLVTEEWNARVDLGPEDINIIEMIWRPTPG